MAKFSKMSVDEAESLVRSNPKEMRSEYERMRDIARKRMGRLKGDEFDWTRASKERFLSYTQMDSRDFAKAYSDLSKFLSAKRSTLGGQKEIRNKTMYTLNKAIGAIYVDDEGNERLDTSGSHVNRRNYERVIKILDEARKMKITYDSEKIVSLADMTLEHENLDFDSVLDHLDTMLKHTNELQEIQNLKGYSFDEIIQLLGD